MPESVLHEPRVLIGNLQTVKPYVALFGAPDDQFLLAAEGQSTLKAAAAPIGLSIFFANMSTLKTIVFEPASASIESKFSGLRSGDGALTGKTRAFRRNARRQVKTQNRSAHTELNFVVVIKRRRRGNALLVDQSSVKTAVVVNDKILVFLPDFGVFARNHHGIGFHHDVAVRIAPEPDAVFCNLKRHRRRDLRRQNRAARFAAASPEQFGLETLDSEHLPAAQTWQC